MKPAYPAADYHFRYRQAPVSGNRINGVGVADPVRPVQIFHGSGKRALEWQALELFFLYTMPLKLFWRGLRSRWLLRRADGAVAPVRTAVTDEQGMAADIKATARRLGAGAVGITTIPDMALYQGYETPYRYAISIAYPMDYGETAHVTGVRGGMEAMRAYLRITGLAVRLALHIRKLGWPARAYCESADILHIPIAVQAGIGELGKHGSLINREMGANFRLATVLTELPLAPDRPVDIGVQDLCRTCRRCTMDCPAGAISDRRQLVRGVEKWYVDFDKCVPYFAMTYGCGICIQVCPWSKPGRGPGLAAKLLGKRKDKPAGSPDDVSSGLRR